MNFILKVALIHYTRFNELAKSNKRANNSIALCCNHTIFQTKLQKLLVEMF